MGLLFHWFTSAGGCSFNTTVLSLGLALIAGFSALSVHPAIKTGSLFPAGMIALYSAYLSYSAMASEPRWAAAARV